MGKKWYESKTLWANLIAFVAVVCGVLGVDVGLDEKTQAELVVGIMAIVNIILRLVTKEPIEQP